MMALAAAVAGACASSDALLAQLPSGVQAGTLVIEPKAELYGTMYRLPNVQTCVGNTSDPKAYGVKWTGLDGRVTHTGVPLGSQVYVTVASTGKKGFGNLQGQRINYVLKSSGLTLAVEMPHSSQPGPTCETAIGMEPAPIPSKAMPQEETTVPLLDGTLKVLPGAVVNSPTVTLYTATGSPHYLEVAGVPTHWRVTTSATPPAATSGGWSTVTIQGWGRINAATIALTVEGKQTLYLYLKNAIGVSPGYPVEVTYLDTRPCVLEWRRTPDGNWNGTGTKETFTIARGGQRGWAGDGVHVNSWENKGPHTLVIRYTKVQSGGTQSEVRTDTLAAGGSGWGFESFYPTRHAKYADCK